MVRLSPKHGVNPAIPVCFFCNKEKNEILLFGRLLGDEKAPHKKVLDKIPCDECQGLMKQGIICISVRDGENGENPYRTGKWFVVTEDLIRRMVRPLELCEEICKKRVCFIPESAWNLLFKGNP